MTPMKLDVYFALLCYGGNGGTRSLIPEIATWLIKTQKTIAGDKRCGRIAVEVYGGIPLTMVRNKIVKDAKEKGFDVVVMIDSDNVPDLYLNSRPWAKPFWDTSFDMLYERQQKQLPTVICSPYCGPPPHPVSGGEENVYVFYFEEFETGAVSETGIGFRVAGYSRSHADMMRGIQEIAAGPTGLIMYSTDAFDLMPVHEQSRSELLDEFAAGRMDKATTLRRLAMESWFFYEYTDQTHSEMASTEDVANTREIQLAAMTKLKEPVVFCNWDAWAGHMKPKCVGKPEVLSAKDVYPGYVEAVMSGREGDEELREVDYTAGAKPSPDVAPVVQDEKPVEQAANAPETAAPSWISRLPVQTLFGRGVREQVQVDSRDLDAVSLVVDSFVNEMLDGGAISTLTMLPKGGSFCLAISEVNTKGSNFAAGFPSREMVQLFKHNMDDLLKSGRMKMTDMEPGEFIRKVPPQSSTVDFMFIPDELVFDHVLDDWLRYVRPGGVFCTNAKDIPDRGFDIHHVVDTNISWFVKPDISQDAESDVTREDIREPVRSS